MSNEPVTEAQRVALLAPLSGALVKTRKQGGRSVPYIEGWKAIETANAIFGFDGWTRELRSLTCVWEGTRKTKSGDMAACSYSATVRVYALKQWRDGSGYGHGMGAFMGEAHENALKEAETDAMKRALMTFGYPFGLALYDKAQEHVDYADGEGPMPKPNKASDPTAAAPEMAGDSATAREEF